MFEMAAAYLHGICRNHPFIDGNKRTAVAAALTFLEMNGVEIEADEDECRTQNAELRMKKRSGLILPSAFCLLPSAFNVYSCAATMYCSSFPSGIVNVQTRRVFCGKRTR